jgi:hypothetical protein
MQAGDVCYYRRRKAVVVEVKEASAVIQIRGNVIEVPKSALKAKRN